MNISSLILLLSETPALMYFIAKYYELKELSASVRKTQEVEESTPNPSVEEAHDPALRV